MSENEITVYAYLQNLANKKLTGSKCQKCNAMFVPPRKLCTKCNSTDMVWIDMSGKGKVAAFSCIGVGSKFMVDKGYSMKKPYCFSVIQLDEGPMISAQLVGINEIEVQSKPPSETIGKQVKVKFLETPVPGEDNPRIDLGFEPI